MRTSLAALLGLLGSLLPTTLSAAPASATPAIEPGPGWFLLEARTPDAHQLVLVEPDGTRHQVFEQDGGDAELVDWSPDGTTALVYQQIPEQEAILVDVASGTVDRIPIPRSASVVLLDPAGDGVLVESNRRLGRIARDGTWTRFHQVINGRLLPSIDGTTLFTVGTNNRHPVLRELDAESGELVRRVPAPCYGSIGRWWDEHRVLLSCNYSFQLLDPVSGEHRLVARLQPKSLDLLFGQSPWPIGPRLYIDVYDSCESPGHLDRICPYVARLRPDGRLVRVDIPTHGLHGVDLIGAAGSSLLIQRFGHRGRNPFPRTISWFDPVTRRERPLLTASAGEGFSYVLPYGERQPSMF